MGLKTLETVTDQVKSTARNAAAGAGAQVRRETSVTGWANALLARSARQGQTVERRKGTGVYTLTEEEIRAGRLTGGQVFTAPDGYVRKSPVQPLVVSPDWRKRIIKRVALAAVTVVIVILAVYAIVRLGVLAL